MTQTDYKCRFIKPNYSDWHSVMADSFEEAAQDFHGRYVPVSKDNYKSAVYVDRMLDKTEFIYFALIEIEGHGELVVRTYYSEISRKGRKPNYEPTILDIAKVIGWERDPNELLEYWRGEDSPEKALKDKFEKKGLYKKSA